MKQRVRCDRRWRRKAAVFALLTLGGLVFSAGCPRDQQQVNEHQRVLQSEED